MERKIHALPVKLELFTRISKEAAMHILLQFALKEHGCMENALRAIMEEYNILLDQDFFNGKTITPKQIEKIVDMH